jgi:hypothetical protein
VLGQVAGKADQLVGQLEEHAHPRAGRVEAGFAHPLGSHLEPSHQASRRELVELAGVEAQRPAHVAQRAPGR